MTRRLIDGAVVLATLLAAAACSQPPNLVVARDPIPPPSSDYKVICSSFQASPFQDFISHCRPVAAPARIEKRTVVRVKG